MSALKAQAIEMIGVASDDDMPIIVSFLERFSAHKRPNGKTAAEKRAAFEQLEALSKKHEHLWGEDFDPDKELEEALVEKYGPLS